MAKLIYFFSFAVAMSLGSFVLHAEGTDVGEMDEEVEAARDETQGTIDEQQQQAAENVDGAEEQVKGQAGPEDAMDAVDEAKSQTAY